MLTTCESACTLSTSSHVRASHTNIPPQSLPVDTYASSHMNATDFKKVFTFLCPTYRRTAESSRSIGRCVGSSSKRSHPASEGRCGQGLNTLSRGTDTLLLAPAAPSSSSDSDSEPASEPESESDPSDLSPDVSGDA